MSTAIFCKIKLLAYTLTGTVYPLDISNEFEIPQKILQKYICTFSPRTNSMSVLHVSLNLH
ncbi:MAG: hypothetical protein ACI9VM_000149 [Candidatus Azotimanducaceae bacterium]|jgi:hypothetical protein